MPWLSQHSQITAWIIFKDDGEMHTVFVVLLDGFDDGDLSGEREVKDVATGAWPQANAITNLEFDPADRDLLNRRLLFQKLPFKFVHRSQSAYSTLIGIVKLFIIVQTNEFHLLLVLFRTHRPHRAVQLHHFFGQHSLGALKHPARVFVCAA